MSFPGNSLPVAIQIIHPFLPAPAIVKPKPPSVTSIPAILKVMQDEWDAIMLHTFTQRQQLQTARQELSHALYQHDASCRVIARLTKEVTAAREALATLKPQAGIMAMQQQQNMSAGDSSQTPMDVTSGSTTTTVGATEAVGLSAEVIEKLQEKATVLTKERKKRGRTVPEELATQEQIKTFRTLASHPGLHSASAPGILTLDIGGADHSRIITGGNDKTAVIFSRDTEQVVKVLKGHTKRVTLAVYHPEAGCGHYRVPRCLNPRVAHSHGPDDVVAALPRSGGDGTFAASHGRLRAQYVR